MFEDDRSRLSLATVVYYGFALLLSSWLCVRHGFQNQVGWIHLVVLAAVRVAGNSCLLVAQNEYNEDLISAAAAMQPIGLVMLVLSLQGFLDRVDSGSSAAHRVGRRNMASIAALCVAALVLYIIGAIRQSDLDDAGSVRYGQVLDKVGVCLLLVAYVELIAVSIYSFVQLRYASAGDKPLAYAGLGTIPFFIVRFVYAFASAFNPSSSNFNWRLPNVMILAFTVMLMEFFIMVIFIIAGFRKSVIQVVSRDQQAKEDNIGMIPLERGTQHRTDPNQMETGNIR